MLTRPCRPYPRRHGPTLHAEHLQDGLAGARAAAQHAGGPRGAAGGGSSHRPREEGGVSRAGRVGGPSPVVYVSYTPHTDDGWVVVCGWRPWTSARGFIAWETALCWPLRATNGWDSWFWYRVDCLEPGARCTYCGRRIYSSCFVRFATGTAARSVI